jgi:hypothetical protein
MDWYIEQIDVEAAFLYGQIDSEVYIELPQGHPEGPRKAT